MTHPKNSRWAAHFATLALVLGSWMAAAPAQAAAVLPFGTLNFIAPTGTAFSTDTVDVWVRFTLDSSSPELKFSSYPLTGIDAELIPTQGFYYPPDGSSPELRDFAQVDGAYLNVYAGCTGSFINDCTRDVFDYNFDFNFGANSVIGQDHADLAPGGSLDFILGSFTPKLGGAAAGTYDFSVMGLSLAFIGVDATNNFLVTNGLTLATQCADCTFTRTVSAAPADVPEPSGSALALVSLACLGWATRRRSAHSGQLRR